MNSNSLQYSNITNPQQAELRSKQTSLLSGLIEKISNLLTRSEMDKARARYRAKIDVRNSSQQDVLRDLPVEHKLRLGMYRFMD